MTSRLAEAKRLNRIEYARREVVDALRLLPVADQCDVFGLILSEMADECTAMSSAEEALNEAAAASLHAGVAYAEWQAKREG